MKRHRVLSAKEYKNNIGANNGKEYQGNKITFSKITVAYMNWEQLW